MTAVKQLLDLNSFKNDTARLIGAALVDDSAWQKLAVLCDSFGHRMNGTPGQLMSVDWAYNEMLREGLENVRKDPVMVPNWIRGDESVTLLNPYPRPLVIMSYGNSVGTPKEGLTAEAMVVSSFEELASRADEVPGKIVVFCPPWTSYPDDEAWKNYLDLRHFRISGHAKAAQLGAIAVLLRSIYPPHARQAHTGALTYTEGVAKIPSAALSPEDALMLERMHRRGQPINLTLKMQARVEADIESANVIGEIVGREKPEEVIVLACQFDSWDSGVSAQDDGAGAIVVWESLRLMKKLGIRPRRTIRTLLCTNEENGGSGGIAYRDKYRSQLSNHIAMLEADSGVVPPLHFRVSGCDETIALVKQIGSLAKMLGLEDTRSPVRIGTAEDIHASVEAGNIPSLTLQGNNEPYSRYHHAHSDMVEAVSPVELARATAAVAVIAYVLAEMEERLPTGKGEGARGTYAG
ncbi:MAG: M28 family peptidase [Xanthomonadales bacterium]|nr:M28 family peptidase [Xanthomonadales bacterium]